jgi:hypothetical protein
MAIPQWSCTTNVGQAGALAVSSLVLRGQNGVKDSTKDLEAQSKRDVPFSTKKRQKIRSVDWSRSSDLWVTAE